MRETLKIKEALKLMEMCVCVCVYSLTHIYIWRMGALVVVFIHQNRAASKRVALKCVGAAWFPIVRTISGVVYILNIIIYILN